MRKKILIIICAFMVFAITSCSNEKQVKADTPLNTLLLTKMAINTNNFENLNVLLNDSNKGLISKEELKNFNEISTSGAELSFYGVIEFTNGEKVLVKLYLDEAKGEYQVESITRISNDIENIFE